MKSTVLPHKDQINMKKRFLIFTLSFLLLCGWILLIILIRDFYIINRLKISHEHDCCSGCKRGEMCLTVCLPCCDKGDNIWNIIILKKKYNKTIENINFHCADF